MGCGSEWTMGQWVMGHGSDGSHKWMGQMGHGSMGHDGSMGHVGQ